MKNIYLTTLSLFLFIGLHASNNYWSSADIKETQNLRAKIIANNANIVYLDYIILNSILTPNTNETIEIPFPDGSFVSFDLENNTSMAEELKEKFPNIKTFNISNKGLNMKGKIDITHKGFHAMIYTPNGTLFVDPYALSSNNYHISYWKKDFDPQDKQFECEVEEMQEEMIEDNSLQQKSAAANGTILRTYRIAISTTAEYTAFHGGTVADGLAAVVTTLNRINGVYEKDFSVTMTLIANNNLIIYTDASTDPFTNPNNPDFLLSQNQTSLQTTITNANYDIGHVVGRSGSGLASFGVVCRNDRKGQGTTGINNPIGDPFDIDFVAHEIGHQFGGSHTYNGNGGSCAGNIEDDSAFEPGSGTTIMAYAGICGTDNDTQDNSDDYFHARSLEQIIYFSTTGSGKNCAVQTNTNNSIPVVDSYTNSGFTIPHSTPFELEASATDADGDVVTYCWEQYDLGSQGAPNSPTGNDPLFRSFSPETTGTRVFPQISDILNETQTLGEILADYERSMKFKLTIRDNNGGTDDETMTIDVEGDAGPFEVTSQNTTGLVWEVGQQKTITWNVADTDESPVSCATVSIFLSIDGGYTFPITLATNLPNTGSGIIGVPAVFSNNARIKIKGDNNIFFNINSEDISLNASCENVVPTIVTISNNVRTLTSSHAENNVWYRNGSVISGENGQTLEITEVGTYSTIAAVSNCESAVSNQIEFTKEMLVSGIYDNVNTYGVNIFPNPAKDVLNINLENVNTNTSLIVKDVLGKTVIAMQAISSNNILDVKQLTKGIYFVEISDNKTNYTEKIIIR